MATIAPVPHEDPIPDRPLPDQPAGGRRVRLLDPHTVNQIAAGEVVERPASVVKELVENALDAGATRIEVELEESGRARIVVRDNGCGMSAEDALASLQRHATSKIRASDDLLQVRTLGFRGEALPSIASVSRFQLWTADQEGAGTLIEVEGGEVRPPLSKPRSRGTEITVESLFFNTPARLKFLKTPATELGACMEAVSKYAIANPHVAFRLMHGRQEALSTAGDGDRLQAIASVWGRDLARGLAEVDAQVGGMRVHGFVSPPHLTRPTRTYQYVYVNGRPVRTRTLTAALDLAYRDITPERRFPILALMIEVDPERIDVNVSPTKTEIKFQQEGTAFDALRIAIRSALMEHGMIPNASAVNAANEALRSSDRTWEVPAPWQPRADGGLLGGSGIPPGGPSSLEAAIAAQAPLGSPRDPGASTTDFPMPTFPRGTENMPFLELLDGLKVVGQAMNSFIVAETAKGIVIIDQHVAHERILYEYLCGLKGSSAIEKQPLLVPETITLDRRSAVLLRERLDELARIGFDLEPFGGDAYVIRAVPAALRGKAPQKILRDMVEELVEHAVERRLAPTREQLWITSACKMAVKAGDPLSHAEMEKLIQDLATTENPYLCPHGRPITLTVTLDELIKKFKR